MHNYLIYIAIISALLLLPLLWRLSLSLWSSIFQFYTFPLLGFYPSLALLSTLSLTPNLIQFRRTFLQWPILILTALLTLQVISLSWSVDRHFGMAIVLYETPFLILYIVAFNIAMVDPAKLCKLVKIFAVLSLIPTAAVILFSVDHPLNLVFLKSAIGKFFINPNSVETYLHLPGHDHWLGKPHFFINPNVGGGYFGVCSLLFFAVGSYCRLTWLKCIAILHWIVAFLSFSTAAIGLAILIPLALASISFPVIRYIGLGFVLICSTLLAVNKKMLSYILFKFKTRMIFWKAAATFFPHHILLGLGFGGWGILYKNYREHLSADEITLGLLTPNLPPHNAFIQLWSQSGIFSVLFGLMFMVFVLWFCWRAYRLFNTAHEKLFSLCVLGAFIWVFLQGMGENWGITGEIHVQPILAITFGLLVGLYYRKRNEESKSLA